MLGMSSWGYPSSHDEMVNPLAGAGRLQKVTAAGDHRMRPILLVICALFLSICLAPSAAASQVSYEGCYVGRGYPVASVEDSGLRDVAMARVEPGVGPVIYYNPRVLAMLSPQTRIFFYFHECAHHVLGHTIGSSHPLQVEQQADCWAIRSLVATGRMSRYDVDVVQGELSRSGEGDWTHLPGPARAINLVRCLE